MSKTILSAKNLKTHFYTNRGVVKAVNGVNFELSCGECLCLVGESGCGKSVTALSLLRLLDSPPARIVDGKVSYGDIDLVKCPTRQLRQIRGKDIAMIFQEAQSALNPVLSIGNQITEQIKLHEKISRRQARDRALALLEEMGIPSAERVIDAYPHQLSGGMKQRAMIAMSLSCDPQILIADEPTTAVDVTIQAQILEIFRNLRARKQMSFIFITHDLAIVNEIGDRAVVMYGGRDVETAPVSQIINNPRHPYTKGLIACLPDISKTEKRLESIPGNTPNPIELPPGCPFHPRCPKAMEICNRDMPLPITISQGHTVSCHLYT
ncbi:MAG: ABC transporter ATP-binding protein [Chloroflexi bacterium]|nr:ABC transporter ATP-binding protein [Chloroflexota bacterium]MBM3183058.1 ABC transporter ATP-binding protein [Chloroflexota bacterium]MBM4452452.1 ABC transporter ATP-binding protein [Chloroflexota bacterium]MBM4453235.1 ABC transporter ATP-binding protein [Chloroflexota bacterium]